MFWNLKLISPGIRKKHETYVTGGGGGGGIAANFYFFPETAPGLYVVAIINSLFFSVLRGRIWRLHTSDSVDPRVAKVKVSK